MKPQAYPEGASAVELVETHASYLFLTDRYVYKVKKPVDYGFLDFTSLEKRRYYCNREVELNRRISPDVYLGVVEIRRHPAGYSFAGPGRPVEYAVKMRRLPRGRAMNLLLQRNEVQASDMARLAARIAAFHRRAETGPRIARLGGVDTVRRNVEENLSQTRRFVGSLLSQDQLDDLEAYGLAFLDTKEPLLRRRAELGRVRDCHGDLHTAQIFLDPPPGAAGDDGIAIIDCIEFNDRFRYSDVAADIAFLAMDLDFHGRPDLSRRFVDEYVRESGDPGVAEVLDFFKGYRAHVRGKVTALLLDSQVTGEPAWQRTLAAARSYFRLATPTPACSHGLPSCWWRGSWAPASPRLPGSWRGAGTWSTSRRTVPASPWRG
jgi:aminoglycoside phosphotransferase family enzyme